MCKHKYQLMCHVFVSADAKMMSAHILTLAEICITMKNYLQGTFLLKLPRTVKDR